ncbi:hypothetical protein GX48_03920 [Paracoccidioides brasiliensis]|nr:hypothetical protein GX48_03920 [Paracoccidioides brasiliensis]
MTGSKGSNNGKARRSDQIVFNLPSIGNSACPTIHPPGTLVKIVNRFSSPKFHMANTGVVWAGRPYGDAKTELDARRKFKSELEKFTSVHCIGVKMRGKWVYKELARESV